MVSKRMARRWWITFRLSTVEIILMKNKGKDS